MGPIDMPSRGEGLTQSTSYNNPAIDPGILVLDESLPAGPLEYPTDAGIP